LNVTVRDDLILINTTAASAVVFFELMVLILSPVLSETGL
jgi:hypothetical protein